MKQEMENTLISALDFLEDGDTAAAILARYADEAEELRPYLETATQLSQLSAQPTIAAQQRSQEAFLAAAAARRSPQAGPPPIWFTLRRLLMPVASLAVVLILFAFTLVTLSGAAVPGDGLYPVKRGLEELRLVLAVNSEQSAVLAEQFQQERVREVEALLRAKRTADVLFEGRLESMTPTEWIIAGVAVRITADTEIEGRPRNGELARVDGRTADGQLTGREIRMLTGPSAPEETPQPALIPPTVIVETPQAEVTADVTPTPLATAILPAGAPGADEVEPYPTVTPPAATQPPANDNSDAGLPDEGDDAADSEDESSNDNDHGGGEPDDNDNDGDDEAGGNDNGEEEVNSNDDNDAGGDDDNSEGSGDSSSNENGGDDDNDNDETAAGQDNDGDRNENDDPAGNDNDDGDAVNDNSDDENDDDGGDSNDNEGGDSNDNENGEDDQESERNDNDDEENESDSGGSDDNEGGDEEGDGNSDDSSDGDDDDPDDEN